jgi:hypothetical protein
MIIMKIKYLQTLAIYIYMAGILSSSPFQNSILHPSLDPKLSELLAEVRDGSKSDSNSGEQLLSIRASLGNPRVPLRSSHEELCPGVFDSSIRTTVRPQSAFFFSTPARSSLR